VADKETAIHLSDPRAMRALAHPTRLRLLGELRARGPQNVGMLSDLLQELPGSVSYHLRTLAKHGFVTEAPEQSSSGRETWWRAAHARTTWDPAALENHPELRVAGEALERVIRARWYEKQLSYLEHEASLDPAWVQAAAGSDAILHLTVEQLAELRDELRALAARWKTKSNRNGDATAEVTLIYHAFRSDLPT
jgi:DNA-binding transcriptional ArsR family regulator